MSPSHVGVGSGGGRKRLRRTLLAAAFAGSAGLGVLAGWIHALGPAPLGQHLDYSAEVVDREGRLLRPYATREGRWRFPAAAAQVDPSYLELLFAYEDKRFRSHPGVDPLALARAALDSARAGRIVSGGSTLTMQVARLLEPRRERALAVKLREMVRAVQLERALGKDRILALYLGLAPYGGNIEGVRAASLAYFGKEPRRLTLGEAALLVALPQAPELRRPDRRAEGSERARRRVLDRLTASGLITADDAARAKAERMPVARLPMPMLAPHAADQAVTANPKSRVTRLTIDADLQKGLEQLARERARMLGRHVSVAIVAVDHATGEILARVSTPDYFDRRRAGQVDLTQAVRSPGSALKPFIYGLGFEDGVIHPETLIEDRPIRFGAYAPKNFDSSFQGAVTIRKALQLSLNAPAVALLEKVRASRLTARLAQAGGPLVLPRNDAPGLALGLGGGGIKLIDLTRLYAGLARLGETVPLVEFRDMRRKPADPDRLLEPVAAWYVGQAMLGTAPPENAMPERIAFKTGTSYGHRDAWALGFDGGATIGVWVGRPDGAPVPGLTGRNVAAPLLFDAFARLGRAPMPLPPAPSGAIVAGTAKLPPPLRHFRPGPDIRVMAAGPRILFPPAGAKLDLGAGGDALDPIAIKVAGGLPPLTVLANGFPLQAARAGRASLYTPEGPGFVRLTVVDAAGAADSVMVRVQ